MKKEQLIAAAKELNELFGIDPAIPTKKSTTEDELTEKLIEAAEMIEEGDEISEETIEVLTEIGAPGFESDEDDSDEDSDDEKEEAEEEEEKPAKDKKAAKKEEKAPAKKVEMKPAKGKKVVEEDPEDEEEEEKPTKKADKKPAKKEAAPVKKEKKEKGPGVIQTIADLIENSGEKGISKDKILEKLEKVFPDKALDSMKGTINVQVPNRISKERFLIERLENGNYRKAAEKKAAKKK